MLGSMKIGARLFSGFAVILLLVCLMAVVSLGGSTLVSQGIDDGERVNGMMTQIQSVRLAQADYTAHPEKVPPDQVREKLALLLDSAQTARQTFTSQDDQTRIDQVVKLAGDYRDQFNRFVELEQQKSKLAQEMTSSGGSVLKTSRSITKEQNQQLVTVKQKNQKAVKDITSHTEYANRLIVQFAGVINLSNKLRYELNEDSISAWEDGLDTFEIMFKLMEEKLIDTKYGKDFEETKKLATAYKETALAFTKGGADFAAVSQAANKTKDRAASLFEAMQADVRTTIFAFDMFLSEKMALAGDAGKITRLLMEARQGAARFRLTSDQAAYQEARKKLEQIIASAKKAATKRKKPEEAKQMEQLAASVGTYLAAFDKYVALTGEQTAARAAMMSAAQKAEQACSQTWQAQKDSMNLAVEGVNYTLLVAAAACVLLGMLLAWLITRGITGPLRKVISGLRSGYTRVSHASQQINQSNASVAESSSRQAAALEQTSASMEQMSAVTKNNAANASEADGLMQKTQGIVAEADQSLKSLKSAMELIVKASDETAKIIKTIDGIAFQTNLLALNAAVEAARAGEAGAGFAVVADEVRSLAMGAADAAKNTTELIDTNLQNIKSGAKLLQDTEDSFDQLRQSAEKASSLVNEIAVASREQADGIDQVNQALTEMDRGTQQTAAMAEESSGASEELTSEERLMETYVEDLVKLVGAGRSDEKQQDAAPQALLPQPEIQAAPVNDAEAEMDFSDFK